MDTEYTEIINWLNETKDEPLEAMAAFFDKRIDSYEEHMSRWSEHYKWMSELVPENAASLIDIGCGSGLELDHILKRLPDIRVTGVDISEKMLMKLKEKHRNRLKLVKADYFEYEMGEECYDAAISFETLHHTGMEKKLDLYRKIYRCLKPKGVYLECDYIAVTNRVEECLMKECKRRRTRDGIPEDMFIHFDTPLTLEHELYAIKNAGFELTEALGFLPGDNHTAMIRAVKA